MVLNEEQQLLRDTIAGFLNENAPTDALRALRDDPEAPAWRPELWQQLCELGVPSAHLPEALGGLGFGWLGFGAVLSEVGKRLSATPLISSIATAANVIRHCGSHAQIESLLPDLVSGEQVATVAIQEGRHFHLQPSSTQEADGAITGTKQLVMDASSADYLLVSVRRADGSLGIARILPGSDGVSIDSDKLMDGRCYSRLHLEDAIPEEWLAGDTLDAGYLQAVDEATIAISAEMLGGARELLEQTIAYLNEREQFGVKIGSFQALQHRCALAYCQLELAESSLLAALSALDQADREPTTRDKIAELASRCKAMAGDCYQHISNEAVQLHGGMGVTDELDIGLFLKRSRVCNQLFGDGTYHRDRFARLRGF